MVRIKERALNIAAVLSLAMLLSSCGQGSSASAEPTYTEDTSAAPAESSITQSISAPAQTSDTSATAVTRVFRPAETASSAEDTSSVIPETEQSAESSSTEAPTETTLTEAPTVPVSADTENVTTAVPETEISESSVSPSESTIPAESTNEESTSLTTAAPAKERKIYDYRVYDASLFDDSLFIGDSISTGLPLYRYLDGKNVFAKIGLNPSTALTKKVPTVYGDLTAAECAGRAQPDRVYIMLGSNGVQWLSSDTMTSCTEQLCEKILAASPSSEIVIISVPPVTKQYDQSGETSVMYRINEYNAKLKKLCDEKGYTYVDVCTQLKDTGGYFKDEYAAKDGLHFQGAAYNKMLGKIYVDIAYADAMKAEEEKAAAEKAAEESTSGTTVTETGNAAEKVSETSAPASAADAVTKKKKTVKKAAAPAEETEFTRPPLIMGHTEIIASETTVPLEKAE
ncbi:MAG: hypothetical protein J6F31_00655 [Oscillospiraceae bacterium]|nr:hypothetical protein [Oscillospiraceae bacterium]